MKETERERERDSSRQFAGGKRSTRKRLFHTVCCGLSVSMVFSFCLSGFEPIFQVYLLGKCTLEIQTRQSKPKVDTQQIQKSPVFGRLLECNPTSSACTIVCSVRQCVAVCCSVLQCVAVCCRVLQCVAVGCSVLQCVAVCCSVGCLLECNPTS